MESDDRLLESVPLENGLTVFFHDSSKRMPGGRCQIRLIITIPLEIKEIYFEGHEEAQAACEAFRSANADGLCFRQEKVRTFVKESEAGDVLRTMREECMRINRDYLSNPDFEKRFVLRKYSEWKESEVIRRAREQAMQDKE